MIVIMRMMMKNQYSVNKTQSKNEYNIFLSLMNKMNTTTTASVFLSSPIDETATTAATTATATNETVEVDEEVLKMMDLFNATQTINLSQDSVLIIESGKISYKSPISNMTIYNGRQIKYYNKTHNFRAIYTKKIKNSAYISAQIKHKQNKQSVYFDDKNQPYYIVSGDHPNKRQINYEKKYMLNGSDSYYSQRPFNLCGVKYNSANIECDEFSISLEHERYKLSIKDKSLIRLDYSEQSFQLYYNDEIVLTLKQHKLL